MQKIIGVTELQRHLEPVLDEVAKEQVSYVLTRGSRPEAALISYEEFLRFQGMIEREKGLQERWERSSAELAAGNAHFTDEEVEADVKAAVEEVRAERWTREQAETP